MGKATIVLENPVFSLPIPMYKSVRLGTLRSPDGDEFVMYVGADKAVIDELREKSLDENDTEIQKNTSDRKRFGEGSYEEWYAKDRTPFSLIHIKTNALAAFVWFGPKPLGRPSLKYLSEEEQKKELEQKEDVWHTLVYRSYPPYRGKGITGSFVRFAIERYMEKYPQAKLWVGMSADNAASTELATRLGFKRREEFFDAIKNWMAMTLE